MPEYLSDQDRSLRQTCIYSHCFGTNLVPTLYICPQCSTYTQEIKWQLHIVVKKVQCNTNQMLEYFCSMVWNAWRLCNTCRAVLYKQGALLDSSIQCDFNTATQRHLTEGWILLNSPTIISEKVQVLLVLSKNIFKNWYL